MVTVLGSLRLRPALFGALMLATASIAPAATAGDTHPVVPGGDHERVVPLAGGQNFRDLGGYRTQDGRTVRWGLLYRSGSMVGLTAQDFAALRQRNIRTVVDFRSVEERDREPVDWPSSIRPAVITANYTLQSGGLFTALAAPTVTAEQARAAFQVFYAELPFQFADQYRALFAQLLAGRAPLIFNCSAGKDRTGVAAALVLVALGVPRRTIVQDYLLSNRSFTPGKTLAADTKSDGQWRRLPDDVMQVMMSVDATYLDAAFAAIERQPGGMRRYFRDQLGLRPSDLVRLRTLYLR